MDESDTPDVHVTVMSIGDLIEKLAEAHNLSHDLLGASYNHPGNREDGEEIEFTITGTQLHLFHDVTVLAAMAFEQQRQQAIAHQLAAFLTQAYAENVTAEDHSLEDLLREDDDDTPLH